MSFICDVCHQHFASNYNLKRHEKRHTTRDSVSYTCDVCQKKYTRKKHFDKHQRTAHGQETIYECATCSKKFSKRKVILDHIRSSHSSKYECNLCEKRCPTENSLSLHRKRRHTEKVHYECDLCSNKFTRKCDFDEHLKTVHGEETKFECATCSKIFSQRKSLVDHIRSHDRLSRIFHECCHCSRKFAAKSKLTRHLQSCRSNPSNTKRRSVVNRYTCGVCNWMFDNRALVCTHYEEFHSIPLKIETLVLKSADEFEEWKSSIQRDNIVKFIKQRSTKSDSDDFEDYVCHRSSIKKTNSARFGRSRFPKRHGSKKLDTFCPAQMHVRISKTDGTHAVRYTSTHIGHSINDRTELRHIFLTKQQKLDMAARLVDGAPKDVILRQMSTENDDWDSQLAPLRAVDIGNVASSYDIDERIFQSGDTGVDMFVGENKESVFYYKGRSMEDDRFGVLKKEDFVLVFMNKTQEKYLRRYGNDVVCFDGTRDANGDKYVLHTLLVLDIDRVEYPAAFIVTNRNDQTVIDIFVRCIKERCGNIEANVLMSESTYYNSWIRVMDKEPAFHLYCTWRVNQGWTERLAKKKASPMVREVKRQLNDLRFELDPVRFEEKLSNFLAIDAKDVDEFIDYFRQNYSRNTHCWAYAYRQNIGVNVNVSLEAFHRKLQHFVAGDENIESPSQTLRLISEYLEVRDREEEIKRILGSKITSKVKASRCAHRQVEKLSEDGNFDSLVEIDDNTYFVQSFADSGETCVVRKKDGPKACARYDDVVCGLPCELCGICLHEYECSCAEMAICFIMCKHIHTVGIYKQKHKVPVDVAAESFPIIAISQDAKQEAIIFENDFTEIADADAIISSPPSPEQTRVENDEVCSEVIEEFKMHMVEAQKRGADFVRKFMKEFVEPMLVEMRRSLKVQRRNTATIGEVEPHPSFVQAHRRSNQR